MAKWGEGDPRWIVEERPDGTNVNNWHWSEKNADNWSKQELKVLFTNFILNDPELAHITITSVDSCSGEARITNRKGKVFVFFEWNFVLSFKGFIVTSQKLMQGKLEVSNFTEDPEEFEISVIPASIGNDREALILKSLFKGTFRTKISSVLEQYIVNLKNEYSTSPTTSSKSETIVKSRTVINRSKLEPVPSKSIQLKKQVKKKNSKKSHYHKSDDLIFYISLLSIVGLGAVIAIKLVNKL